MSSEIVDRLKGTRIMMLLENACDPDPRVNREAESLVRAGAQVDILCWVRDSSAPASEYVNGVHIHRYPPVSGRKLGAKQFFFLLKFYRKILDVSTEYSADIVVAHDYLMLPLGVLLSRKLGAKLVYDAHEVYRWMDAGRLPDLWLKSSERLESFLVQCCVDCFITVSEQRRSEYWIGQRSLYPVVVGNWYNKIRANQEKTREKYAIPLESRRVVGYAGTINENRLLEQLVEVGKLDPTVTIAIAGRGDGVLVDMINAASVDHPNILYLGWIGDSFDFLASCDAIFYGLNPRHPYAKYAAPNTLYTAIAADRPLVAIAGGEVAFIAEKSGAVMLAQEPTAHSLLEQINRLNLWPGWGELGVEYTWSKAENILVGAYEELVQGGNEENEENERS